MEKKVNLPKKGAARKWAARFRELGKQAPPQDLVDKINNGPDKTKKIASPTSQDKDLDL